MYISRIKKRFNSLFRKEFILVAIITVSIISCTKVINLSLNNAASETVIEGNITNLQPPYHVTITRSVNMDSLNIFPVVSGAVVIITDNTSNIIDTLKEAPAGTYTTQKMPQGIPGHTYSLYVSVNNQVYLASSTMPNIVMLDSITFTHSELDGKINTVVNFQDPPADSNYYTFIQFINGVQYTKETYVFDDRLSNGKYISEQLFMDSSYISSGDLVKVQMNCVDKNVWQYFNTLQNATGGGGMQSTAPANPVSNISNNALGYFSASSVQNKTRVAY